MKNRLTYVTSAAASDGGSLRLGLKDQNDRSIDLLLDRQIGTKTYNEVRDDGGRLDGLRAEDMLDELERLLSELDNDDISRTVFADFIEALKSQI